VPYIVNHIVLFAASAMVVYNILVRVSAVSQLLFCRVTSQTFPAAGAGQFEDDELDEEELGHAETYADYMPAKCQSKLCVVDCFMCTIGVCLPPLQPTPRSHELETAGPMGRVI